MSARAPLDLAYCIKHSAGRTAVFGQHYTSVTPVMAEHVQDFITYHPRDPDIARLHLFEYMTAANRLTNATATGDFQLEWATIPEVDEVDIEVLEVKIRSTRFDMSNIQTILFGGPLTFTNEQKWDLATIIIDHQREDWRVRAVAIMMTKHARLGRESRLSNLEPEIMGIITKIALL
jgi:hypothetical protein